jgi:hypothetical protein
MNNKLKNGKTILTFLAARKSDIRREQLQELDRYVQARKSRNKKVLQFIQYWGASSKSNLDAYDYQSLLNLFGFLRIVEKHYQMNVQLTVIFTDTHLMLNGYDRGPYQQYFKQVRQVLNQFNYNHILMSELLIPFLKRKAIKDVDNLILSVIEECRLNKVPENLQQSESFTLLKKSASRHSSRYFNKHLFNGLCFDTNEQAAHAYVVLNQLEKKYIEASYPQSIFLTYSSKEERILVAPALPTLQIFSLHQGVRSRPWFHFFQQEQEYLCAELQL